MQLLLALVGLFAIGLVGEGSPSTSMRVSVGDAWSPGTVTLITTAGVPEATGQDFRARVLDVVDGDTVILARGRGQVTVRIHGIDAPEGAQPFGSEARKILGDLVLNQLLTVRMRDMDAYGRLVAALEKDGIDVGLTMVQLGAAWHYRQYLDSDALADAERRAREEKRGLWALTNPQPPWSFRSDADRSQSTSRLGAVSSGEIHGNRVSKVFHTEGCQHFRCKNCTAVFANRAAATAAGYRPHADCARERM